MTPVDIGALDPIYTSRYPNGPLSKLAEIGLWVCYPDSFEVTLLMCTHLDTSLDDTKLQNSQKIIRQKKNETET